MWKYSEFGKKWVIFIFSAPSLPISFFFFRLDQGLSFLLHEDRAHSAIATRAAAVNSDEPVCGGVVEEASW